MGGDREVVRTIKPRFAHSASAMSDQERADWLFRLLEGGGIPPGEYCLSEFPREICSCGMYDLIWEDP